MRSHIDDTSNDGVYQLVRANILAAVKTSYFIDSPNHVVRKLDRLYVLEHHIDHLKFLEDLLVVLDEMKSEYYYEIGEYDRIRSSIDNLKKYIAHKLENE